MSELKFLVCVDANNHNKFYKMTPLGNGNWVAEWGRVGANSQTKTYSDIEFWKKYNEKIKKGYEDKTDTIKVCESISNDYKPIVCDSIRKLVESLKSCSRQLVEKSYNISATNVNQKMIDDAQGFIDKMGNANSVYEFNSMLTSVYKAIPRKMRDVRSTLALNKDDFEKIILREQNLLDTLKGEVNQSKIEQNPVNENETYLDAVGVEMEECSSAEVEHIKKLMGGISDKFSRAWKVTNKKTQERFDKFVSDNNVGNIKELFHGSRNENWMSIINTGLSLRPNAVVTGKMFGYGEYFAPSARKSMGYTSLSGSYWASGNSNLGYMGIMSVACGKSYDVYSHTSQLSSFDFKKLQNACNGAYSLYAHKGSMLRNDEIIVYKEEQITIKYLVEIKN